jgi:hypothetical protein
MGPCQRTLVKEASYFPDLSFGVILGCGLVSIKDVTNRHLPGESRLFHILVSELLFLIWKVRNDCVTMKGGNPIPERETQNKWLYAINWCLGLGRLGTNKV